MAADPKEVKKMLADIESARTHGRSIEPPSRLSAGNILGSRTDAFNEAVKQQTKTFNKGRIPEDPNAEIMDMQSDLRKKIEARKKQ